MRPVECVCNSERCQMLLLCVCDSLEVTMRQIRQVGQIRQIRRIKMRKIDGIVYKQTGESHWSVIQI